METLLQINKILNSRKGVFISFEGGEGVGKSTQIDLLKKVLVNKKINVLCTREPGGTREAEELRKFLKTNNIIIYDGISGIKNSFRVSTMSVKFDSEYDYIIRNFYDSCIHRYGSGHVPHWAFAID